MKLSRVCAMAGMVAAVSIASVVPAFAEGSFTSSLGGVLTDFHSRTWPKKKSGDADTKIFLTGCSTDEGVKSASLKLFKQNGGAPDTDLGAMTYLSCFDSIKTQGVHDWGPEQAGTYYFDVYEIGGAFSGPELSVKSLTVDY